MEKTNKILKVPPIKVYFPDEDKKQILDKINECLTTGMLAQGKNVKEFEDEFARYLGVKHAIAVNSGGSAIEVVMRALDVKGKEVLIPANTFLATASSVILAGGIPKFVDIETETFSVSLEKLKSARTKNTVGIITVHIGGIVSPWIESIKKWSDENGLWLFEDCAHAHGSKLGEKFAGTFGICSAFSFFATKVITSAEGGMIVTDNSDIASKVKILRDYGKTEPWVSFHTELGANWRMSDIHGIIGLSQLKRLDEFINWREGIANLYTEKLKKNYNVQLILPVGRSSWYKYILLLPKNINRDEFKLKMKEHGVSISGGVYDLPLHKQPVFSGQYNTNEKFTVTEDVCTRHVCLPIYYGMTNEEAEYVIEVLNNVLKGFKKED